MNARHALSCVITTLTVAFASTAQAGERWDALWRNADQRGEQLLHDGKAADAAQTYRDPRRKAYADLAAGDYKAAAQGFAAFDDSESQYNRGNALAHGGDLNGALKAYDAALAKDPHNTDAKKNRELVAKALQQQQKKDASQSQQKNQQQNAKNAQDQNQQQPSSKGQKQSDPQSSAQKNDAGQSPNNSTQAQANDDAQNNKKNAESASPSPQKQNASQARQADDKAQAQQDAQDAANAAIKNQQQQQTGTDQPRQAAAAPSEPPKSERQLAEEQWLRQIPDDPGGLLRRKFMIEHLMRKQQDSSQ